MSIIPLAIRTGPTGKRDERRGISFGAGCPNGGRSVSHCGSKRGDYSTDPHNVFDFMMDTAEQHGTRAAFISLRGIPAGLSMEIILCKCRGFAN